MRFAQECEALVRYVPSGDAHLDQKWLVLEGSVAGCPEVTKRRTISTAALVDGSVTLEGEKAHLLADVREYYRRWQAVRENLENL